MIHGHFGLRAAPRLVGFSALDSSPDPLKKRNARARLLATHLLPLSVIASDLGFASSTPLTMRCPELSQAQAKRIKIWKKASLDGIKDEILRACNESRPPTVAELACRLGISRSALSHFPQEKRKLRQARKKYRQRAASRIHESIHKKLARALHGNSATSVKEVAQKIGVLEKHLWHKHNADCRAVTARRRTFVHAIRQKHLCNVIGTRKSAKTQPSQIPFL